MDNLKEGGRDPLIRMFKRLDSQGLLQPVITLLLLIVLIGVNSKLHSKIPEGVIFLLLVFIILLTGRNPAINFFGSSAIALFIGLHVALYGFYPASILASFLLYLIFQKHVEKDFRYPITIYLLIDSLFTYLNIASSISYLLNYIGLKIFSANVIGLISVIPLFAIFYFSEIWFERKYKSGFWKDYGVFVSLLAVAVIFQLFSIILRFELGGILGIVFILIYMMGMITYVKENTKMIILLVPLILYVILLYKIKSLGYI